MDTLNEALGLKIPQHVAVILDGNGRWAKQRHMPRTYGHKVGSKVVEDMLTVVDDYIVIIRKSEHGGRCEYLHRVGV